MSIPPTMPIATTHEAGAMNTMLLTSPLYVGLCELTRLHLDMCGSLFSGVGPQWQSLQQAQTPEEFVTAQASSLPWFALQFAGYTLGWMDLVSKATSNLRQAACERQNAQTSQLSATLDGITNYVWSAYALAGMTGEPGRPIPGTLRHIANADAIGAAESASDPAKRRSTSAA